MSRADLFLLFGRVEGDVNLPSFYSSADDSRGLLNENAEHSTLGSNTANLLMLKRFTVDFTLLFRAALRSSLGNWVLGFEVANYVAN